jgi:hypothetical protein
MVSSGRHSMKRVTPSSHEPIGMSNRTFLPQLVPDRIRIVDPCRIQVVEITGPVSDRRTRTHVSHLVFQ